MRKFITFFLIALLALGCKVRVEGPSNESVHLSLSEVAANDASFWDQVKVALAKSAEFVYTTIEDGFERIFGSLDFSSRWWFAFYLGGLLIMSIGLKTFLPLCWIGVIMQYAYLQFMSPPFFMLWPSIVGWGWMILCLIPMVFVFCTNALLCVSVIIASFKHGFVNFLIMLIPVLLCIMTLFSLIEIAFTDHIELVAFFILGAIGGGKKFIGTFTDANGNSYDIYR